MTSATHGNGNGHGHPKLTPPARRKDSIKLLRRDVEALRSREHEDYATVRSIEARQQAHFMVMLECFHQLARQQGHTLSIPEAMLDLAKK